MTRSFASDDKQNATHSLMDQEPVPFSLVIAATTTQKNFEELVN